MSSFSVKIGRYSGIISKFVDNCFTYSLTFLLHKLTSFAVWRCYLNSFLKWASTCQTTTMLFIFSVVQWKWPKSCCQVEGYSFYFCRIGFPPLTCLAAFCKIVSCVLIATYSFLLFLEGKIMLFHEALRVDMAVRFMLTLLYGSIRVFFVTKVIVWLAVICMILIW